MITQTASESSLFVTDSRVVIRSKNRENVRYVISDVHDFMRDLLHGAVTEYSTLGDGETQHTGETLVTHDNAPDFFLSLHCCMAEWRHEIPQTIARFLRGLTPYDGRRFTADHVKLLQKQKLRRNETDYSTLFVCFDDGMKFSRSDSKKNLRNWHECNVYMLPNDPEHEGDHSERLRCYERFLQCDGSPLQRVDALGMLMNVIRLIDLGVSDRREWANMITERNHTVWSGIDADVMARMLEQIQRLLAWETGCRDLNHIFQVSERLAR